MSSSSSYYDQISTEYASLLETRAEYLRAVNDFILQHAPQGCSYLDVGAGNGSRSQVIADNVKACDVTLLDESREILEQRPPNFKCKVVVDSIIGAHLNRTFNLITCLWNVLGHIPRAELRLAAIENISSHMAEGGTAFIDVNNRYNVSAYGIDAVMRNVEADALLQKRRGNFTIKAKDSCTSVYIHNPFELDSAFEAKGLRIVRKVFIDYENGNTVRESWRGQVVYQLKKQGDSVPS